MKYVREDDPGQLILDQLKSSLQSSRYNASSVLAGLAYSFGGSLVIFIAFLFLRPRLQKLYCPNTRRGLFHYPGNGLFSWVKPLFKVNDDECMSKLGLDAVAYMRFVRMLRNVFIILAVLGCGIGIPINVIYNLKSQWAENLTKSDAFILMTPSLLDGMPIITHVVLGWTFNIVVFAYLWYNFRDILRMRVDIFKDPQHSTQLENRSVMVTDLSQSFRSKTGLRQFAKDCDPNSRPVGVSGGYSVNRLEELIRQHRSAVIRYERLTLKQEALIAKRGFAAATENTKLTEEISHSLRLFETLEHRVAEERARCRSGDRNPLPYGFISYGEQNTAHHVAKKYQDRRNRGARIQLAPAPNDIIWPNLVLSRGARYNKQMFINIVFTVLLILWIVPNAFIGCFLTNLSRIAALWKGFGVVMQKHPVAFAILQGILAPLVTSLIFMILPWIMRKMSRYQGKLTRNQREHEVIRKLYIFFFFNNFFVFTLMGVGWDIVAQALDIARNSGNGHKVTFKEVFDTLKIAQRISTAIINISSFWVMYLLKSNMGLFLDLIQALTLTGRFFSWCFTTVTPRQRHEWAQPQPFPYALELIWPLFHSTIALGFTTIQPLILLIVAFYFVLSVPLKKYGLMYMFTTKYESNASYWPQINNIILFALGFGNLMLMCVVWVQAGWKISMGVAPLPVVVLIFKIVCWRHFETRFYFFQDSNEEKPLSVKHDTNDLEEAYENPALYKPLTEPILGEPDEASETDIHVFANKQRTNSDSLSGYPTKSHALPTGVIEIDSPAVPPAAWDRKGYGDEKTIPFTGDGEGTTNANAKPVHVRRASDLTYQSLPSNPRRGSNQSDLSNQSGNSSERRGSGTSPYYNGMARFPYPQGDQMREETEESSELYDSRMAYSRQTYSLYSDVSETATLQGQTNSLYMTGETRRGAANNVREGDSDSLLRR